MRSSQRRFLLSLLICTLVYCLLAVVTILIGRTLVLPLWPPAGIALGAVLLLGYRAWPIPFLGGLFVGYYLDLSISQQLLSGVAATLEALCCVWLLRNKTGFSSSLSMGNDIWALLGVSVLVTIFLFPVSLLSASFTVDRILGYPLGVLLITPWILAWFGPDRSEPRGLISRLSLYAATGMSAWLGIFQPYDFVAVLHKTSVLLVLPPLAWAVMKFSLRDVTLNLLLVTGLAIASVFASQGIFVNHGVYHPSELAIYLWLLSLTALIGATFTSAQQRMLKELQRGERNFREKNEQLTTLIEGISDAVFFKDGDGRWLEVNRVGLALFNLQGCDWMGKNGFELAAEMPDATEAHAACVDSDELAYLSGAMYSCEEQIVGSDGTVQYFDVRKFPHFYPDGRRAGLVVYGRNSTAEKTAARQLEENKARYKEQADLLNTVLDTLPAQVVLLNEGGRLHGSNRLWKIACRMHCQLDIDPENCSVHVDACPHMQHTDDVPGIAGVLSGKFSQYISEYATETDECGPRSFSQVVTPIVLLHGTKGAVVMVSDITALKNADKTIRRSEQKLRAITENSPDLILRLDRCGRVMFANRAMVNYLGWNARDIPGASMNAIWRDEATRTQWRDAFARLMAGNVREDIVFEVNAGGVSRCFQAYMVTESEGAAVVSVLAVIRDISSLRQAEQLLRESRDHLRLLAAEYEIMLEAEKRYIARELHDDTGQILSALRMNIGMLCAEADFKAPVHHARAGKMTDLLDRATASIRHVVAHLRPAVIDMGLIPALEWLCEDFAKLFPAISYSFNAQGHAPGLNENLTMLVFRMAQEALTNATKHARATEISVSLENDARCWRLIIMDNGTGFDVLDRGQDQKCFGLLGLRERALALGGELDISSLIGAGTRVMLLVGKQE